MIPRLIHLVKLGKRTSVVDQIENWHRVHNPDYAFTVHSDATSLHPRYRQAWDECGKSPEAQVELLRWSVVEQFGGWCFSQAYMPQIPLRAIEDECQIQGDRMFVALFGRVLCGAPDWPGWATIDKAIGDLPPNRLLAGKWLWQQLHDPCQRANWIVGPSDYFAPYREVFDADGKPPSPATTVPRYVTAVARWIAAGFPRRSDDEVDQIFEICRACKWMHAAGYCQKCGCRLSKSRQAMTNKIRMATEHCPLPDQKW
jgi:hypothetical protein